MDAQRIDGATRLVGLLGHPVAHSLSPAIHNHAFRACGLPFAYVPLGVHPHDLHLAVGAIRACGFAGANVTIPHKTAVIRYCDRVSPLSERIGAVNTLYLHEGMLWGTTTDPDGFFRTLAWMKQDSRGSRCVILGNGGTARTLGFALALERLPSKLTLVGRNEQRVSALAEEIAERCNFQVAWTTFGSPQLADAMGECSLCVNCTSVGMHPWPDESPLQPELLHENMALVDMIYNPTRTKLLRMGEQAGCRTQNGLRMLLYQGLASFKLWTGVDVGEDIFDISELEARVAQTSQG